MAENKETFKVGSRKSQLALIQTNLVISYLKEKFPDRKFDIVTMTTVGDQILDKPLPKIGEKSLFTKELELALTNREVDFVVHSLKDLPTLLPMGLTIGAILEREDPRDALIIHPKYEGKTLNTLPKDSVIGTSSLRRAAQLARNYPELKVESIRGNLNTRLKKLDEDDKYSGIILAAAGIKRMKWESRIAQYLEPDELLFAVGQGALAVECRYGDDKVLKILEALNDGPTILKVVTERSFLKTLGGGCSAPVAVNTLLEDGNLSMTGAVWSLDGSETLQKTRSIEIKTEDGEPPRKCPYREPKMHVGITARNVNVKELDAAEDLGVELALDLIKVGALDIIGQAKILNEIPESFRQVKNASSSSRDCATNIQVR